MDIKTTKIRYQKWAETIQNWSSSGLTKRAYCQTNGISEKQFYYYQRRIRSIVADHAEDNLLPVSHGDLLPASGEAESPREAESPQIVRVPLPGMASCQSSMICFGINGVVLSVPENISEAFLSKLLKAAGHDTF